MMLNRSITWLLFLSLPLMALARHFPNGAVEKGATRQVWLKISVVFLRDDSFSQGTSRSPVSNDNGDREAATVIARGVADGIDARRQLEVVPRFGGGVGSRPPRCSGRCGACSPCLPINVPVGGAKTDDEYYPEVWRCQCDDTLYMP